MASNNSSLPPPPMFVGENYHLWAAKMKTYLRAQSLWDVVENGSNPPALPNNPTVAQIRNHNEEVAKEGRALAIIHAALHDDIFIKILNLETAKEAWDKLKEEFQGSERTKKMQVLNLRREFEALKMKETETVREFSDRISKVVSQIRLLGEDLSDQRVVEKILVCLPERFEAKISSLEETKDFSQITLAELVNALQATEQRRSLRLEENVEGAFVANTKGKNQSYNSFGKKPFGEKKGKGKKEDVNNKGESWKKKFPTCQHCKKDTHLEKHCWYRPDVKCRACNQLGHVEKVCKNKANQQRQQAQVVEHHQQEEQLFMASCYSTGSSKETWLIDSGCTNHMTHNVGIFKELDKSFFSKVTIGNGEHVDVKGKGVVAVETPSGIKYISDVLFVPEINQSLLSVGQMMEKNYSLHFKDKRCTILDPAGSMLMTVEIRGKSFPIEWKQTTMHAFPSSVNDSSLWHKRLGHFSYSALKQMSSHDLVENLPIIEDVVDMCDGAIKWLDEVEIIFEAMGCSEENKTTLGTYALREEAIVWWRNVRLRIGVDGVAIVWETFKREFLRKYFPADVKNKKVIEFMELKQGNLSVAEYSAKFEALCVFSPHYNTVGAEEDKCVKFESGLRPDIKLLIGFSEIRDFPTLMTKARIYLVNNSGIIAHSRRRHVGIVIGHTFAKHKSALVSFGKVTPEHKQEVEKFELIRYSWDEFFEVGLLENMRGTADLVWKMAEECA
ncbi:unnamed protein product [Trifolium pratense]|uniref:Uncharacterized protein n=1 Tax=Trifolium pratense TaxID=57577 RepID=A0ACB0K7X1_TRIPR|nr:unnamed protein product [Trifolium pratense]